MQTNVVFARVGWMRYYGARPEPDGPRAGGAFNDEHEGAEIENFKVRRGRLYGFVRIPSGGGFNQMRVTGSVASDESAIIVLFAKRPGHGGQVVVGWHGQATCLPEVKELSHGHPYNWTAPVSEAVLLPDEARTWEVQKGKGATGQSNVLYPRDEQGRLIRRGWANKIVRRFEGYAGPSLLAAGKDMETSLPASGELSVLSEELIGLEGNLFYRMTRHRGRERKLRERKIQDALARNGGRLRCQVPGCGFDFLAMYGELGRGYAQVHHLAPIGSRSGAERTRQDDLVPPQGMFSTHTRLPPICRARAARARSGPLDDPRLWTATTYCMPIERRIQLLGFSETTARRDQQRCLDRVEQARRAQITQP